MAQAPSTESRDRVRGTVPKLIDLSEKVLFGDVWERPQLSKRDRSLIVCATLIATYRPEQLRGHLQRALVNGVTKEELSEVITHLAFYAGWPAAMTAANIAREVFEANSQRGARHAGRIHRSWHDGCQHGRQLTKGTEGARRHAGGARYPPRGSRASSPGWRGLGGLAAGCWRSRAR